MNADVNLNLSLENNKYYIMMDPSFAEEELGITEQTTLNAHIHGFGYFIHPVFTPALQKNNFELQMQLGMRKERSSVHVEERLKRITVEKDQGEGKLNLSGKTIGIEVKYHFPLKTEAKTDHP